MPPSLSAFLKCKYLKIINTSQYYTLGIWGELLPKDEISEKSHQQNKT
jgi:hypothetical protein